MINNLIRKQDFLAMILYFIGFHKIISFYFRFLHIPIVRFIAFHEISPKAFKQFKVNLSFLHKHVNIISMDDFFNGNFSYNKINIVITFDDGYKSWITYAIPVLKEYNLQATFFISSGFVNLSPHDEKIYLKQNILLNPGHALRQSGGCLNGNDVKLLVKEGHIVGGHTVNHCFLSKVLDYNQIRFEIGIDKIELERMTEKEIRYFSYPLGAFYNSEINIIEILKEVGYKGAVTTKPGINTMKKNPFLLNRYPTYAWMNRYLFRAQIYGNLEIVNWFKSLLHI
jgi:peptidoglycan/xylan/chitin deacetylase (PgdA/CDA1 family)